MRFQAQHVPPTIATYANAMRPQARTTSGRGARTHSILFLQEPLFLQPLYDESSGNRIQEFIHRFGHDDLVSRAFVEKWCNHGPDGPEDTSGRVHANGGQCFRIVVREDVYRLSQKLNVQVPFDIESRTIVVHAHTFGRRTRKRLLHRRDGRPDTVVHASNLGIEEARSNHHDGATRLQVIVRRRDYLSLVHFLPHTVAHGNGKSRPRPFRTLHHHRMRLMHIEFPRNEESVARPRRESLQTTERRHKLLICCFHMWTNARIVHGDSVANELDHVVRHSCSVHDKYGRGKTNEDIFPYLKET